MFRVALLALVVVSCGGSKPVPVVDDFSLPVLSSCRQIDECASGCTSSACILACENGIDSTSVKAYGALATCATDACTNATDAGIPDLGAGPCKSARDTSAACRKCLGDAQQGTGACETEYAACSAS